MHEPWCPAANPGPRKTEHPGFVETPTPTRRSKRASDSMQVSENAKQPPTRSIAGESPLSLEIAETNGALVNGSANGPVSKLVDGWEPGKDPKIDHAPHFDFGGTPGVSAMIIGFPLLMWYMWIGATYYDGRLPLPEGGQSVSDFIQHLSHLVYEGAFPSLRAWTIYWTFCGMQAAFYVLLPGITQQGKPLPHEGGKRLDYYCSGVPSWYATLAVTFFLHTAGLFKMYEVIDEFGPIMSVAIISGFLVSTALYASAFFYGKQHRMTGYHIYDFFMGAELNPRIFGIMDLKMFFEVRMPWYMLFLISLAVAARQYEHFGWVSGEVAFLVMAHFLYANACSKAEGMIITSWDMYYEKLGFMLTFWNLAGVPLSYCHCAIYLANRAPSQYHWNKFALTAFYVIYLFVYWVWDTCNHQKNHFRQAEHGCYVYRTAPPQLPWQRIENPKFIKTSTGDSILMDGWYGYARKVHYTCDMVFALSWALITGFDSPFPWFYPVFFAAMIVHRAIRDVQRCRIKYGEAWREYERQVPYLFIPVSAT